MTIANAPPFTLTNGVTADATQVMANFDQIVANVNANAAANGANSDITSLTGLTTPLGRTYGGSQFYVGGTSTGAANAHVVATVTPTGFSLYAGAMVAFISGFNNSAATTLNVGGTGVKNVFRQISGAAAACAGGEIVLNQLVVVVYDGTQWQIINNALLPTEVLRTFAALSVATGDVFYGSGANTVARLAAGTNGHLLTLSGGVPTWAANTAAIAATAAEMEAASVTTAWSSPGLQQRHPGHPKAWVRWTPQGVNGACTVTSSYNVSGVSRTAAGTYTVTFTTAFADTNYCMVGSPRFGSALSIGVSQGAPSLGSCVVYLVDFGGGATDTPLSANVMFYGDQ